MPLPRNHLGSPAIICIAFFIIFAGKSLAGELRPSDHGLQYQLNSPPPKTTPAAAKSPPEMLSFFGKSPSPPPSDPRLLPKAAADDDSWWREGSVSRRERVMRHVFLAASIICGVSAVALLVAFTVIYFFRYRNQNSKSSSPCNDSK